MATANGIDGVLNYQTDLVAGSDGWVEMTNIGNLDISYEAATSEVTTRAGGGFRQHHPTLRDVTITFEAVHDLADTGYQAFLDAFNAGTPLGIQCMATAPASEGIEADMFVSRFDISQPKDGAQMTSIELKLARTATAAVWKSFSGS